MRVACLHLPDSSVPLMEGLMGHLFEINGKWHMLWILCINPCQHTPGGGKDLNLVVRGTEL